MLLFIFTSAALLFYLSFCYKIKKKYRKNERTLKQLQQYTEELEHLYSNARAFRHDYINILSSMSYYIKEHDIIGLEQYFNEQICPMHDSIEKHTFDFYALKNLAIPELKGLLYYKFVAARQSGIRISLEIITMITDISMDVIDLTRILGILLDNAIEASSETEEPYINLAFINNQNSISIIISNNFKGEICLHSVYSKGYSTKGVKRGLGLYTFRRILNKYPNILVETTNKDKEWKQIIDIFN